jgi:predicted component of type VI protein secretion system
MPLIDGHPSVHLKASLLDRLAAPDSRGELSGAHRAGQEGEEPGMRVDLYQDTVLRDLEWLFNAVSSLGLADKELRRKYPRTASSVLGYGLRGILGRVVHDPGEIQQQVEAALAAFEPRLVLEDMSLKVTQEGQLVEIEIKGLLLTQHAQRRLWIRTDLETLNSKLRTEANG